MNRSKFQFSNPIIEKIKFTNNELPPQKDLNYKIGNNIEVKQSIIDNSAKVLLTLKIVAEGDYIPFDLEITTSAKFKWDDDTDSKFADSLLSKNAPALLLSYARPMISLILSQSGFPNFNIPFIDFSGQFTKSD